MNAKRFMAWLSAVLLAAAPLSAQAQTTPPPSRARPAPETDEGGIWGIADRTEAEARLSGELNADPALNAYLRGVACRVASEFCGDIRLYVMNRPFFNAQMAPNGYMEVWSGLLLRAENEAELAFVLGHEIGHYEARHSLESLRGVRNASTANLIIGATLAIVGTAAAANSPNSAQSIINATNGLIDVVYLGAIAMIFNFSREMETQADGLGAAHAIAAGYDANAGANLWSNLVAETRASDFPETRRRETRASIFNTHPLSADRIEALQAIAARQTLPGAAERERYRAAIRPHLDAWLRDELRRRDYGQSLHLIERLARSGEDLGMLNYYRGECFRLRRGDNDLVRAREAYELAIQSPDAPPAAWRQLGEIYERERRPAEAAAQLAIYLEKAPGASDRLLVQRRLNNLTAQLGGQPQ